MYNCTGLDPEMTKKHLKACHAVTFSCNSAGPTSCQTQTPGLVWRSRVDFLTSGGMFLPADDDFKLFFKVLPRGHTWVGPGTPYLVLSYDSAGSPEESCLLFNTFPWSRLLLPGNLTVTESDHLFPPPPVMPLHFSCSSGPVSCPLKCQACINNQSALFGCVICCCAFESSSDVKNGIMLNHNFSACNLFTDLFVCSHH